MALGGMMATVLLEIGLNNPAVLQG
jgi:hypothetical protein